jgi:hypothetical protein
MSIEDIDKRFKKLEIQELTILLLDLKDSSEEEKISAIYRIIHHSSQMLQKINEINLIIKYDQSFENEKVLRHFVNYSTNSYRYKNVVFYGDISELLVAGISQINRKLNTKIRCFKTKKDAIKYILIK